MTVARPFTIYDRDGNPVPISAERKVLMDRALRSVNRRPSPGVGRMAHEVANAAYQAGYAIGDKTSPSRKEVQRYFDAYARSLHLTPGPVEFVSTIPVEEIVVDSTDASDLV